MRSVRSLILIAVLASCAAGCLGQTLARRGWAGSGITVDPWWKSAVFYQVNPSAFESGPNAKSGFPSIAEHLDYLQQLGVDAIVLSSPRSPENTATQQASRPFDSRYGSDEDLNVLLAEASRKKVRVLVDLDVDAPRSSDDFTAQVRFWLSRGAAGFRLMQPAASARSQTLQSLQHAERLRQLRRVCASVLGQRVLVWDTAQTASAAEHPYRNALPYATASRVRETRAPAAQAEMVIDARLAQLPRLDAVLLRAVLRTPASPSDPSYNNVTNPMLETDRQDTPRSFERVGDGMHDLAIAKLLATTLLTSSGAPLLYFGQEIGLTGRAASMPWDKPGSRDGAALTQAAASAAPVDVATEDGDPESLLNWYRKLSLLRRTNSVLRGGSVEMLATEEPETVAWVRRSTLPGHPSSSVLVVCNLSAHGVAASLTSELQRLGLPVGIERFHGLATAGSHAEPTSENGRLRNITLPPYGVYIGELRPQPGLESVVLPPKHPRRSVRSSKGR